MLNCVYYGRHKLHKFGPVVIDTQGVENGNLMVSVDNTFLCSTYFLAANTQ